MPTYKDGISPAIRSMVEKINEVGVNKIRDYCDKHRHRLNFRRQLAIIRSVAQKGYTYTADEFGISKQAAEMALKRIYGIALEVEALKNDQCRKND